MKLLLLDIYSYLKFLFSPIQDVEASLKKATIVPGEDEKIFVIGMNKTGTTSVKAALQDFDIPVGHQGTASNIFVYEGGVTFIEKILEYCKTAKAFQDIPFSVPHVYKVMHKAYPNAKFILTCRDDASQWFNSLKKFTTKVFGKNGRLTKTDMILTDNYRKGSVYIRHKKIYGTLGFFDEKAYKNLYNNHIEDVTDYFSEYPDQLLVINIAEKDAYKRFCDFLGREPMYEQFPWENKTKNK
ncbi:MAG: sulfotransferase [Cyclobacteriaceae bacterium]